MAEISNELTINTDTLKRDIETFNQLTDTLFNKELAMEHEVIAMSSMWSGKANTEFCNQFGRDCQRLESMVDYLKMYSKKLSEAMEEYNKCDTQVYDIVKNIKI